MSLTQVFDAYENKRICGLVMSAQYLPLQLKSDHFSSAYFGENRAYYANIDRSALMLESMDLDVTYANRINQLVRELILYFKD